jgi:hypothetical protein
MPQPTYTYKPEWTKAQARWDAYWTLAPAHLEFVIRHLRPEGLLISTSATSIAEGEELLDKAVWWAGTQVNHAA